MAKKDAKKSESNQGDLEKWDAELARQAADLEELKTQLNNRQSELDTEMEKVLDRAAALDEREEELNARQAAIEGAAVIEAEESLSEQEEMAIADACKALGIGPEYVFARNFDRATGEAVILTDGGVRVRWKSGDEVEPLSEIEITGINPKKRKPIVGKALDGKE